MTRGSVSPWASGVFQPAEAPSLFGSRGARAAGEPAWAPRKAAPVAAYVPAIGGAVIGLATMVAFTVAVRT